MPQKGNRFGGKPQDAQTFRSGEYKRVPHCQAKEDRRKCKEGPWPSSVQVLSGLTAALDLALSGYRVRVYEKDTKLGGMLAHAIPRYRLPVEALAEDIEDILATGIEVRTGCEVGKDISFDELRKENDAILIAAGLSESHSLPIPGVESKGVFLGIPSCGTSPMECPQNSETACLW